MSCYVEADLPMGFQHLLLKPSILESNPMTPCKYHHEIGTEKHHLHIDCWEFGLLRGTYMDEQKGCVSHYASLRSIVAHSSAVAHDPSPYRTRNGTPKPLLEP